MLTSIQVRNFAIIDEAEIEFSPGMTVLTGETGAGKSIIVDAMGLVLGERGGSGLVRTGAKRAEFIAEFDLSKLPDARSWLEQQMLDLEDECNLRRVIGADGRSRAFINGNNVPLQSLKTLGELLLDIHGQHFHQSLAKREVQRNLLDYFGGLVDIAIATRNAFDQWQHRAAELASFEKTSANRTARLELLRFQIGELNALDPEPGEYERLNDERSRLLNSGKLADGVNSALQALFDREAANVKSLLGDAAQKLDALVALDPNLETAASLLAEADIHATEATENLRRYADALDMDPARQNFIEERLDAITRVARKHRTEPENIDLLRQSLVEQLDDVEHADEHSAGLRNAIADAESAYRNTAARLSAGRKKAGGKFSSAVTEAMNSLGMPGGMFEVDVAAREPGEPRAFGVDDLQFLISANPGQPPMPLAKVASGGELSRMGLAIQVIASDGSTIPTMVFDEVDSGVGGGVAEIVGLRLRELGQSRQVFCVTHLPQVASLGNNHFRIMKVSDGNSTKTSITCLSGNERIDEIARMLGGIEITKRTRDHAAEMLAKGHQYAVLNKSA